MVSKVLLYPLSLDVIAQMARTTFTGLTFRMTVKKFKLISGLQLYLGKK
jgi:hypothetical protein